jgi:hypothetical protein
MSAVVKCEPLQLRRVVDFTCWLSCYHKRVKFPGPAELVRTFNFEASCREFDSSRLHYLILYNMAR